MIGFKALEVGRKAGLSLGSAQKELRFLNPCVPQEQRQVGLLQAWTRSRTRRTLESFQPFPRSHINLFGSVRPQGRIQRLNFLPCSRTAVFGVSIQLIQIK